MAAHTGHSAILTFLTQSRFSPRLTQLTIYQDTALHLACYSGKVDAAKVLMTAARGDPDMMTRENIWSETAFHAACTSGRSRDLVNYILGIKIIQFVLS